ncbi:arrestin domain-containing protein 3-like [Branchiostoma lanceolatum]|uniref:arrestin domain-containing protein 3-like n=1 Tax=Branchiostoma lanceolatum TaxID=7740 RepID=UPI0034561172
MGKLKSFVVTFDNNKDVYQAGEIVSGKLIADVTEGIKARGVRVKFHGFAYLHWTESHGSGEHRRTEHYSAQETYFDQTLTVWGKELGDKAGESPTLPAGYYEFPFRYQLGMGLPSSFEGGTGYVRYSIKGIVDRPWRFDHTTKCAFTILDMYDLNEEPSALTPSGNQSSKTLCCLCCASGPIELQAQTDRGGYCPGERVMVKGSLENSSNTRITQTSAKIVQTVAFHATRKTRHSHHTLSSAVGLGCRGRMSGNIGELVLPVPAIPPSKLRHCSIIEIDYVAQVFAHIEGPHLNLNVQLPIIIGSVPLTTHHGGPPQPGYGPTIPGVPDYLGATAPPLPPPPTYAAVTGGGANIRDGDDSDYTMGQLTFAPKYMYYDWSQHPQP